MQAWYNVQDKELRLPNGSVLCFRYGERRADINDFIGKEYMDMLVDQAEMLTEPELNTLKSCVRWPGQPDGKCKFILTFNPGNVGHAFLKRIFFEQKDADHEFIQAFGWDNVEWCRTALQADGLGESDFYAWDNQTRFKYFVTRSQYGRELDALPKAMRLGWLLGSMDEFAGQYFDVWSPDRHVKRVALEEWHNRWLGIDWGFGHEAACMWFGKPEYKLTSVYREFVAAGRSPRALAQEIVDRTPQIERKRIERIWLSHDAFAQRTEADTVAEQMADVFRAAGMPSPSVGGKDPKGAATLIYDMLRADEIAIDPNCVRLIGCIPMISRDEDDKEKTVKFEGDDPYDALCIGFKDQLGTRQAPLDVQVRERVAEMLPPEKLDPATPDYNAIAMASLKAQSQINKKFVPVPVMTRKRRFGGGFHGVHKIR